MIFTKQTNKGRDWSAKGHNTMVGETDYYVDYMAVVAAISSEVGVELVYTSTKSINQHSFIEFLEMLRRRNG